MICSLLLVVVINCCINYAQEAVTINILSDSLVHTTQNFYVSYTLDISNFYQSTNVNLTSLQLQYMAKQLSPSVLRIGGGQADYTYYFTNQDTGECDKVPSKYHCFTKYDLEMLMNFVSATNVKLIFGLSIGYPTYPNSNTKSWNSSNTEIFLKYIVNNGYGDKFYGFELGNEVNNDVAPSFQVNAFKQLKSLLQDIYGSKNLNIPILAGPDPHSYTLRSNDNDWKWVQEFIADSCNVVDAFTYHSYVNENKTGLLTKDGINEQHKESLRFSNAVKQYCSNGTQSIYAGEIAEHNNGGTNGLTNKYEDTLWYLDALGTISLLGQDGFFRQQIWGMQYHPDYALLNTLQYIPLPDYWIAVLFNNLMSNKVLNATATEPDFRIYAHCSNDNSGNIIIAYINIKSNAYSMKFNDTKLGKNHMDYLLTSSNNQLDTTDVYLNGAQLKMTNDNKIPSLNGKSSADNPVTIEKYSVGFIQFIDVKFSVCD